MSDLVKRLLDADWNSQQRFLGSRIFGEAADRISQQDAELDRMRRELAEARAEIRSLTEAAIIGEKMWTPEELHEARREAFFQGWEMSETGGMEDTCADAWAFWSLMEDGRDEVEPGRYLRAEETRT